MSKTAITATAALLRLADPAVAVAVLRRCDARTRLRLVKRLSDIPELADYAVVEGTHEDRVALACHDRQPRAVFERLVALDDPRVNTHLYLNHRTDSLLRRRILTQGPPLAPDLRAELLSTRVRPLVLPLVYAHEPALVRRALTVLGRRSGQRHIELARLRGLVTLWRLEGPDAVAVALGTTRYRTQGAAPVVRAALTAPNGLELLDAELSRRPGTAELIRLLRTSGLRRSMAWHVVDSAADPIDWDAVATAHHAQPFTREVAVGVAASVRCPDALRTVLQPPARPAKRLDQYDGRLLNETPAVTAVPVAGHAAGELVRKHLGDNVDAWVVAVNLLDDFTGSLAELLATAQSASA